MVSGSFIIAIAVECVVVGSGSAERVNPPRLRRRAPSGCFFVFSDAPGSRFASVCRKHGIFRSFSVFGVASKSGNPPAGENVG